MEVPCFQDLWSRLAGHGVQVVVVHVGYWGSTEADAQAWLAGFGATFPAIHEDSPYPIMDSYTDEGGVPHNYVIGRDMVIRKDILGRLDCDVLEGHVMDVVYMRDPVDVEMVMDVSDSMNSPSPSDPAGDSKLTMMRQAATMVVDCMYDHGQVDDRMGLIWFTDDVEEYINPDGENLLSIQAERDDLRAQIDFHGTGTCTAMGAGLQTAFDSLSASVQQRFAILCTDGMQNIEPKVTEVGGHYEIVDSGGWLCGGHSAVPEHPEVDITSHDTRVHTIGIGVTADYGTLLQGVADATGGFYRATNDPEHDLDLIYLVDLFNCMAGGSPAIAHHNVGRFYAEECQAEERFNMNRTVRKMTAMLSWKEAQGGDLTFWLYAPDGTLLNLHSELKQFKTYALATIFLPKHQDGKEIPYVGQWRMVITGQMNGSFADYHAFVVVEDQEVKYKVDYTRKYYEVGDLLPIRIQLEEVGNPIVQVSNIMMETAHLRVPLPELFHQYKVSQYEVRKRVEEAGARYVKDPVFSKLVAMTTERRFRKLLTPVRTVTSLQEGNLVLEIREGEFLVPVELSQAGLHTFKIELASETQDNGPIDRVDLISVIVAPGKADPKQTGVSYMELAAKNMAGARILVELRNSRGQLLGPGHASELTATIGKKALAVKVEDLLNSTYQIEFKLDEREWARLKEKGDPVNILFQGKSAWKGTI